MYAYLKIINSTSYPVISVEEDGQNLAGQILAGECSPLYPVGAGSLALLVRQHTDRPFLSIWMAIAPETQKTLVIEDETAYFARTNPLPNP